MSKHIISTILNSNFPDWLEIKVAQIMDSAVAALERDSLEQRVRSFDKTRFAFTPVVANRGYERIGEPREQYISSNNSIENKRCSTVNCKSKTRYTGKKRIIRR